MMLKFVEILFGLLILKTVTAANVRWTEHQKSLTDHPDAHLTTVELIEKHGYNAETHQVTTRDGYILELHRITGRKGSPAAKPGEKPAVLIMHGLLASSAVWVLSGPDNDLAFILSDEGYDVWLGNARGSKYSRKHVSLTVENKEYWSFSWHEIGTIDLPAKIDHILAETQQEKLFYIGHSQGTTVFFVMASEVKAYQEKITAAFTMAPVAYCSRMSGPIFQVLARFANKLELITKLIGQYEFQPTDEWLKEISMKICDEDSITLPVCTNVLFLIGGYSRDQLNTTLLPAVMGHVPAGASVKQFMHYAQLIKSGKFRQYNYGAFKNLKIYKKLVPPAYDLGSIKVPVSLHYSTNDWLAHVRDVHQLYQELGAPLGKFRVPHKTFNHLDFMWGLDVKQLVYNKIISLMSRFKI